MNYKFIFPKENYKDVVEAMRKHDISFHRIDTTYDGGPTCAGIEVLGTEEDCEIAKTIFNSIMNEVF